MNEEKKLSKAEIATGADRRRCDLLLVLKLHSTLAHEQWASTELPVPP